MYRSMKRPDTDHSGSYDYQHGQTDLDGGLKNSVDSRDIQQRGTRGSGSYSGDLRDAIANLQSKEMYRGDYRGPTDGHYYDSSNPGSGMTPAQDFRNSMESSYQGSSSDLRNAISRQSYRDESESARSDLGPMKNDAITRPFERDLRNIISGSSQQDFRQESMTDEYGRDLRETISRSTQGSASYLDSYDNQFKREGNVGQFSRESSMSSHSRDTDGGYYQGNSIGKSNSSEMRHHGKESVGQFSRDRVVTALEEKDFAFLTNTLKDGVDPKLGWSKGSNPYIGSVGIDPSVGVSAKKSYHQQMHGATIQPTASYILENNALMMNVNSTPVSIGSASIKPPTVASISSNPQLLPTGGLGVNLQANLYRGSELMFLNSLQNRNQSVVSLAPVVMSTPLQIQETPTISKANNVALGGSFWDSIKKEGLLSYAKNPVKLTVEPNELDTTHAVGEDFQIPSFPKIVPSSMMKRSRSRSPIRKSYSSTRRLSDDSRQSQDQEEGYRRSSSSAHKSRNVKDKPIKISGRRMSRSRSRSISPRQERIRSRTPERISSRSKGFVKDRSRYSRDRSPRVRERSPRMVREISPHRVRERSPRMVREISPHKARERSPRMVREISPFRVRERSRMVREISPHRVRERSPRMVREISPRRVREISPRRMRERSPMVRDRSRSKHRPQGGRSPVNKERIVRELSPLPERGVLPRHRREMSPGKSRPLSRGNMKFSPEQSSRMERDYSRGASPPILRRISPEIRERDLHLPGRLSFEKRHSFSPGPARRSFSPGNRRVLSPERYRGHSPDLIRRYPKENSREPLHDFAQRDHSDIVSKTARYPVEPSRGRSPGPSHRVSRYPLEDHRGPSSEPYSAYPKERVYIQAKARIESAPGSRRGVGRRIRQSRRRMRLYPSDTHQPPSMASESPNETKRFSPEEDRESPRRSWDLRNKSEKQQSKKLQKPMWGETFASKGTNPLLIRSKGIKKQETSNEHLNSNPFDLAREASPVSEASNDEEELRRRSQSPLFDAVSLSPSSDKGAASPGTPTSDERQKPLVDNDMPRGCSPVSLSEFQEENDKNKKNVKKLPTSLGARSRSGNHKSKDEVGRDSVNFHKDLSPVSLDENSLTGSINFKRSKSPMSDASHGTLIVTDSIDVQDSPRTGDKDSEDLRVQLLRIKEEKVEQKLKKLEEESLETELRLQNLSPDILDYSPQRDTPSPLLDECEDDGRSDSYSKKLYRF